MAVKYKDFGEKIGGARKDAWVEHGLATDDLKNLTDREAEKYVNKAQVWPVPDYAAMVAGGIPKSVAWFRKLVRDAVAAKPKYFRSDVTPEKKRERRAQYVDTLHEIRTITEAVETPEDAMNARDALFVDGGYTERLNFGRRSTYKMLPKGVGNPLIGNKLFHAMSVNAATPEDFVRVMESQAEGKGFLAPKVKKQAAAPKKPRKARYTPPQLENIKREGPDYRGGRDVTGEDYMKTFGFRGGEFGNWLSDNDRRESMNMGYDGLLDLAEALGINPRSITLDGKLGIAFGARGQGGNTVAHYEPLYMVINLTKMKGAGSLAHEVFHFFDHALGEAAGASRMMTESANAEPLFLKLVKVMRWKEDGGHLSSTQYALASRKMASKTQRDGGYWDSNAEMAARAFACYVMDKLGRRSDYIVGHAECAYYRDGNEKYAVFPEGEERQAINAVFDEIFEDLKERGILARAEEPPKPFPVRVPDPAWESEAFTHVATKQMSMF